MDFTIRCSGCPHIIKGTDVDNKIDLQEVIKDFEWEYDPKQAKFFCKNCKLERV